jgi:glycosyltransferase involved in cell wall biosynthesis
MGEWAALHVPHATISVSESLAERYAEQDRKVEYVPNGVTIASGNDAGFLKELGLRPRGYLLYAGRLVPEKGAHLLVEAHARLDADLPLVIAGDTSHSDDYVTKLRLAADRTRVKFLGYIYGWKLATLFRNAGLFVLPSEVEGQPLVLLEALAYGSPVVASDIPQNLEVLGGDGRTFVSGDVASLTETMAEALEDIDSLVRGAADGKSRVMSEHDWSIVALRTAHVYERIMGRRPAEEPTAQQLLRDGGRG